MTGKRWNVLFLCTGNSARSILGESVLRRDGKNRFRAFSAGSAPRGEVNPLALEVLEEAGYPTEGLCSKSWETFAAPGSPDLDIVITVCDNAAGETCPVWPGHPVTAHWGIADPAVVEGTESRKKEAFRRALQYMQARVKQLTALSPTAGDEEVLRAQLQAIGKQSGASSATPAPSTHGRNESERQ